MTPGLPFYRTYAKMLEETNPFNRIHRLIDTFEEFSKFLTIVSIRDFIEVREVDEPESISISTLLINRLYAPTLGTWHEFLYRSAKYLALRGSEFSREVYTLLGYKEKRDVTLEFSCRYKEKEYVIKNVQEAFGLFTEMRNDYAHGATPGDESCDEDYRLFFPLLRGLLERADFLKRCTLETAEIDQVNQPVMSKGRRRKFSLYPFMLEMNGEFYYFNDAKLKHKEKLTFLNYYTARKIVDAASYRYLKKLFPEFDEYDDELNLSKQRLLDTVIGRDEDAGNIEDMVLKSPQSRVFYIFGDPGIGKSAMAVYLHEYYFNRCVKILHMFVHNEMLTLQPEMVFKSLARPLIAEGLLPAVEINTDNPAEIKKAIDMMLQQASAAARLKNKKIIIIIDGLDEAYHISEHLYGILPFTPPPDVNIIYFLRRKDEIYARIYRGYAGWIVTAELAPLKREAVRAIIWQAISKYAMDEAMVDRVVRVSQGNPLYLRFLVNALLEGGMSLSAETLLPRDIVEYYEQVILQVVKRNPGLPVIETALVFSTCYEPLHQEQIQKILKENSIEDIIVSIQALAEIIRPVSLKGNRKRYHLFHKSIADFLKAQYADTAARIEEAALFSVFPGNRDSLEKWFSNFLRGKNRLKIVDEKNISIFLSRTGEFPSAYKILVKMVAGHANALDILQRCCDIAVSRQKLRILSFMNDCCLKLYEISPGKYLQAITGLNRQYPGDEHLKRHIVDALILLPFSPDHYDQIIGLVTGNLLDYSLLKVKSKRLSYIRLINTVSGFARSSGTFPHLKQTCAVILNMQPGESQTGGDRDPGKLEKWAGHLVRLVLSPPFTRLVQKLREKDNKRFITRGNESYRGLLVKGLAALLKMPGAWGDFWIVALRFTGLILKNGGREYLELIKRLRIFTEIMQRSFPLIFTSAENPVSNPMGIFMITGFEALFKTRLKMIKVKDISFYEWLGREAARDKSEIIENLTYLFSVLVIPLSKMFRHYTPMGRETWPGYGSGERQTLGPLLHLLKAEEEITREEENTLLDFLSADDAWENYFATATLIIHGNTEFDKSRRILKRVLEENPYPAGKEGRDSILQRLRLYRQYFTIHSYLLRRAVGESQVEDMAGTLQYGLDSLDDELTRNPEMIPYFAGAARFDPGAPFNPLLPIGIYQARTGRNNSGGNGFDAALKRFLQLGSQQGEEVRGKLADKLFSELLYVSLFYPEAALRTALGYYREFRRNGSALLGMVIEKIALVDLMMPGYLESSVNELGIDYQELKKKLLECKESSSLDLEEVERMREEIRILAWHECLTTLMVSYHRIRDLLIRVMEESFGKGLSLPLLVQHVGVEFMRVYFSAAMGEKIENFLKPPGE